MPGVLRQADFIWYALSVWKYTSIYRLVAAVVRIYPLLDDLVLSQDTIIGVPFAFFKIKSGYPLLVNKVSKESVRLV